MYKKTYNSVPLIKDLIGTMEVNHENDFLFSIKFGTRHTSRGPGLFNYEDDEHIYGGWRKLEDLLSRLPVVVSMQENLVSSGKAYGGKYKNYDMIANIEIHNKQTFFTSYDLLGKTITTENIEFLINSSQDFYRKLHQTSIYNKIYTETQKVVKALINHLKKTPFRDASSLEIEITESGIAVSGYNSHSNNYYIKFNNYGYEALREEYQVYGIAACILKIMYSTIEQAPALRILPWKYTMNNNHFHSNIPLERKKK